KPRKRPSTMLELIRKQQKALMIAVAAVIIVAFAFLYDSQSYSNQGRQGATMVLYEKRISPNKFQNYLSQASLIMNERNIQLVFALGLSDLLIHLRGNVRGAGDVQDLVTNLLVLRHEATEMGIKASEEEIAEAIKGARLFANRQTQQFDEAVFSDFKANIGQLGITEADFQQLIADTVVLRKMRNLLKAGLRPSKVTLDSTFNDQNASVAAFRLDFAADKYAADAKEFTEEELKKFYEDRKADYQAPEKRNVRFVHFRRPDLEKKLEEAKKAAEEKAKAEAEASAAPSPAPAPTPKKEPVKSSEPKQAAPAPAESTPPGGEAEPTTEGEPEEPTESDDSEKSEKGGKAAEMQEADADAAGKTAAEAANEAKEKAESATAVVKDAQQEKKPAKAEPPKAEATKSPETPAEDKKAEEPKGPTDAEKNSEFGKVMNSFIAEAAGDLDNFAAIAEKYAKEAEGKFYAIDYVETGLFARDEPPESLLQNNGEPEQLILQAIFQRPPSQPFKSDAPRDMDSGFVVFKLVEVVPPEEKTFEEAKERVKEDFINHRQSEMLREAAEEAREKIVEAVKSGKAFEDAAKEAGAEYISIPPFTMSSPPVGIEDWGAKFADKVKRTPAGQLTDPIPGEEKVTMIYVAARELREVDAEATKRDTLQNQISSQYYDTLVFQSWLESARIKAGAFKGDLGLGS
ncbi:MAG: SurA N-terminal domain-containing protein, partial [Verrucomicrobiota bacterium]